MTAVAATPAPELHPAAEAFRTAFVRAGVEAGERVGWRDHDLLVGGVPVRLRFAGPALEGRMLAPFEHLPRVDAVQRTIIVWDSASTGVAAPAFPWTDQHLGSRGEVAGLRTAAVRAAVDHTSGSLTLWDAGLRTAFFWIAEAQALPWWEHVVPLRVALLEALAEPERELVHAAAVGTECGGALLAGAGGSGKSTTSVSCLEAGLLFAGDDHVALDVSGPQPVAHGVHRTAKLEPDALERLPSVRDALWDGVPSPDGKSVLLFGGERAARLASAMPLTCVLLPRVTGDAVTDVAPVSAATALRALAPSTIFQVPKDGGRQLRTLAAAVRALRCFELRLGRDGRAPEVISEVVGA